MSAILFLDFDGVLNCEATWRRPWKRGIHRIDREKVALLTRIVAESGCKIVISSAWRGNDRCRGILRDFGFRGRFHRDWRTRWNNRSLDEDAVNKVRGDEIADWLKRNGSPPFAIVDDDSDMLDWQRDRFVQTDFQNGLTEQHAARLVALLRPTHPPGGEP